MGRRGARRVGLRSLAVARVLVTRELPAGGTEPLVDAGHVIVARDGDEPYSHEELVTIAPAVDAIICLLTDRIDADAGALPRAAFADLPPRHQEVLHLRFVEELDYEAVAARLQTTEHAARQRVYRAMQALRAIVQRQQLRLGGSS